MKKAKTPIILFFLFIGIFIITVNNNKKPLSKSEFEAKITSLNYSAIPSNDELQKANNVTDIVYAINNDLKTQMNYYKFENFESAKTFFNDMKTVFREMETIDDDEEYNEVNKYNYNKFTLKSSKRYFVVVSLDDTAIYAISGLDEITNLEKDLKNLGY